MSEGAFYHVATKKVFGLINIFPVFHEFTKSCSTDDCVENIPAKTTNSYRFPKQKRSYWKKAQLQ